MSTICKHRKKIVLFLITITIGILISFSYADIAYADIWSRMESPNREVGNALIPSGSASGQPEVVTTMDRVIGITVTVVRTIAALVAVLFVVWIGFIFLTSGGDAMRIASAKTQIVIFLISVIIVFMTEPIVRFVLNWFV